MRDVLRMNIPIKFTTSWQPECNNMTSTNVCRLDRSSVNRFTAIGLKNKWASGISALQVAVDDDQMLTSHICTKCTLRLVAL